MRREYEAAIGRLITNYTAMALFLSNPGEFFKDYMLDPDERENILSMKGQLSGMCVSFSGKHKRNLKRHIARSVSLMGNYGEILLQRYVNLYPPIGDYFAEHEALVNFFQQALSSVEQIDNLTLVKNVLRLETALFRSLRSVVPGEELEHINDPEPEWAIVVQEGTKLIVRNGVFYGLYEYNLAEIVQLNTDELASLEPQQTALIVLRHFGEVTNTLMRVSPTVLRALDILKRGTTVKAAASVLAEESNTDRDTTLENLMKLARHLCSQQILIEVKE